MKTRLILSALILTVALTGPARAQTRAGTATAPFGTAPEGVPDGDTDPLRGQAERVRAEAERLRGEADRMRNEAGSSFQERLQTIIHKGPDTATSLYVPAAAV